MRRSSSTGRCRKSTGSLVLLFILLSLIFVHGSAKTGYKKKPYPRKKKGSRTTSPPMAYNGSYYGDSNIFDVLSYGAKGDGTTDGRSDHLRSMTRSSSTGRCRKSTGSLVLLFILLSLIFVHGSAKTGYRKKPYPREKKGSRTTSPPIAYNGSYYGDSNIFDVLSYGAKGDGSTDD